MTIAIPSPNAALAALEQLAPQPGGPSGAPVDGGLPPPLVVPAGLASDPGAGTDTFSLSGGAAAALLGGLSGGLADAASAADAAVSAGGVILGLLGKLQSAAQTAADPSLPSDQRGALDAAFKSDLARIGQTLAGASAGGLNLIDGSAVGSPKLEGAAALTAANLSLGGPIIGLSAGDSLSDPAAAAALAGQLGQAIDEASQALGQIASQGQAIETHLGLVSQALSAISPGVAGAINAGLDGDGARLQALQVQQQLAGVGSGLANQAPQAVLALFQ